MTEGTSTFMGVGVGLSGNYEIKGDNDTDDTLTLTGASSSAAGDVFVVQNSTGTEFLTVSSSGKVTISQALAVSGSVSLSGPMTLVVSATTQLAGLVVSVTSTGAITVTDAETHGTNVNGISVVSSSKATLNSVIQYVSGAGTEVSSAISYLSVSGSKSPTYFLKVGNSAFGVGAAAAANMFTASYHFTTLTTAQVFGTLKCLFGSKAYYIILSPDTQMET